MNTLDATLIIIKFITLSMVLLSAGGAVFYNIYYFELVKSQQLIKRALFITSICALILAMLYLFLDAARFSGSIAGIVDFELQKMLLLSHLGVAKLMLILGLAAIISSYRITLKSSIILATIGVSLVAFSFTLTGHTLENPYRLILAPLLMLHLFVVLFWFGALIPLYFVVKMEVSKRSGKIINDFSKKATLLVPLIFVAGIVMSVVLMNGVNFLRDSYGQILLIKIAIFSLLMLIAALNKLRLGPDLEQGKPNAARYITTAITLEIILISIVVAGTTVLTGFYSPTIS